MCAHLRRIRSHAPRPELRSGWADSAKITAISRIGGAKRLTERMAPGMVAGWSARALDHDQVPVRHPRPDGARPRGRRGRQRGLPIGELARRRDIPVQFLEQLFAVLRRAGILRSQRGVKGGYAFARDPGDITGALQVVELLDGPLGGGAESIFAEAAAAARAVLAKATINDVVERENRDAGVLMYYI